LNLIFQNARVETCKTAAQILKRKFNRSKEIEMFTNRFFTVLVILTLAAVVGLTVREAIATSAIASNADAARWEAMGKYYENQAQRQHELEAYHQSERTLVDPKAGIAIYQQSERMLIDPQAGMVIYHNSERTSIPLRNLASFNPYQRSEWFGNMNLEEAQPYVLDSATHSYIAWGEALQAAGELGDSAAGSNTTQENIFAGIDSNLDSATRSYIAWGLALQAKDDIRTSCR
jgi:hypothetical protein